VGNFRCTLELTLDYNKERLDAIDTRLGGVDGRLERIDSAIGLKPPKPKSPFVQFRVSGASWTAIQEPLESCSSVNRANSGGHRLVRKPDLQGLLGT